MPNKEEVKALAKAGVDGAVHSTAMILSPDVVASLVLNGDLANLTPAQKVNYYNALCERVGLDPATQPFKLLRLKGKEVMHADKGATQQLSLQYKISHDVVAKEKDEDIYTVTIKASMPDGRFTVEEGSVAVGGLKGEDLANARMKAMTKAKRRAVLALLGLGMMDESEIEGLKDAVTVPLPASIAPTSAVKVEVVKEEPKQEPTKMDPKQWLQNTIVAMESLGRVGNKAGAQALGREAKAMLDRKELAQSEFDKVVAAFVTAFPPVPQPALFSDTGTPAEAQEKPPTAPVAALSPEKPTPAPKPEAKVKSEPKKAKTVSLAATLMSQVEEASKVSVLLTIKGRIEKGMLTDQERDILVGSLNAKLTQLTGGKK
jgi:hypothetical protein